MVHNGVSIDDGVAVDECIAVDEGPAVRNIRVVIEQHRPVTPVESPMVPSPSEATEEANVKSDAESETWSRHIESGIGIPTGPDG